MKSSITEYRRRRDFSKTQEPRGSHERTHAGQPIFVIQEHDTDLPHFDLRLEIDGVLKSWVVPEGLPTDAGQRRLALQMEDHPLAYAEFEGEIPEGEYGSGAVRIRDRGTFENLTTTDEGLMPLEVAMDEGYLEFRLIREQRQAVFVLQRTAGGAEPHWLLVKGWDKES